MMMMMMITCMIIDHNKIRITFEEVAAVLGSVGERLKQEHRGTFDPFCKSAT